MIRLASRHLEAQGVEMHQDVNVAGCSKGGSYFVCVASYSRHPYVAGGIESRAGGQLHPQYLSGPLQSCSPNSAVARKLTPPGRSPRHFPDCKKDAKCWMTKNPCGSSICVVARHWILEDGIDALLRLPLKFNLVIPLLLLNLLRSLLNAW